MQSASFDQIGKKDFFEAGADVGFHKIDLELSATEFQVFIEFCYFLFVSFADFVRGEFDFASAFHVNKDMGAV